MDIAKFEEYLKNKGYSDDQINVLKNMYLPNQQKQENQGSSFLSNLLQYPQSLLHGLWESPAEAVSMIGRAIQYPAEKFGIPVLRDIGKWIESGGETYTKGVSQMLGSPEQYATVPRWIYEAGKMTVPSIGLGVLTGTSAIPAGVFGLAQAEEVRRAAEEKGIKSSTLPEIASGLVEALGEYFGTKYLTKLLGGEVEAPQKLVDILSKIPGLRESAESLAKYLKTAAVEAGTEFGQQLLESGIEKYSGIRPEAQPLMEALSVIPPTLLMTAMMSPLEGRLAEPHKYVPEAPPKEITGKEPITPPLLTQEESNLLPVPVPKYLSASKESKLLPAPEEIKYLPSPEESYTLPAPKETKYLPPPEKGGFPVIDNDTDNHILNTALYNVSPDTIRRVARYHELTGDEFVVKDQEGKDIRLTPDQLREYADIKEASPYIINKDVDSAILNYTLKNLEPGEIDHLADVLEEKEKRLGETGHPDMPLGLGLPVKLSEEGGTVFLSPETLRKYADLKRQMRQQEEISGAIPTERVKISPSSSEPISLTELVKPTTITPMEPAFLKRLNDAIAQWSDSGRVKHIASTIVKPNVDKILKYATREVSTNNPEQAAFIRIYLPDGTYKEALVKSNIPTKNERDALVSSIYKARNIANDLSSKIDAPIEIGYYEKGSGNIYTPRTDYIVVDGKFLAPTTRGAQDITNHPGVRKELPNYFISQKNQPIGYVEAKDLTKPAVKVTPSEESKLKQESIQPSEEVRVTEQTPQPAQNVPQPESISKVQELKAEMPMTEIKTEASVARPETPVTKSKAKLNAPQQEIKPAEENIEAAKEIRPISSPIEKDIKDANTAVNLWQGSRISADKRFEVIDTYNRELDHAVYSHKSNIDKKLRENEYVTKISIVLPDGTKIVREGIPYSEAVKIAEELGKKIEAPIFVQGRLLSKDVVVTKEGIRHMTEVQFNKQNDTYFTKEFRKKMAKNPVYRDDIYKIYHGDVDIDDRVVDLIRTVVADPEETESLLNGIMDKDERKKAENIIATIKDEIRKVEKSVNEIVDRVEKEKLTLSKANAEKRKINESVKVINDLAIQLNNSLSKYIGSFKKYFAPKEGEEIKPSTSLTEDEVKRLNKEIQEWRLRGDTYKADEIKNAINKEFDYVIDLHKSDIEKDTKSGAPMTEVIVWLPDGTRIVREKIPYPEATSIALELSDRLYTPVSIRGETTDLDRVAVDKKLRVMSEPQFIKEYRSYFTNDAMIELAKIPGIYDEDVYKLLRGDYGFSDKAKAVIDLIKNDPEKIESMINKIDDDEDRDRERRRIKKIKEELRKFEDARKKIEKEINNGNQYDTSVISENKSIIREARREINNTAVVLRLPIEIEKPTSPSIKTENKPNVEGTKTSKKTKSTVSQQETESKKEAKIQEEAKPSTHLTEDDINKVNKEIKEWRSKGEASDTDEIKDIINRALDYTIDLHKSDIERDIRSGAPTTEIAIWLPDGSKIIRDRIPYSEATSIASKLSSILDIPVFIKGQTVDLDRIAIDGNLKVMSEPQLIKNYRGKFTKDFLEMEHKKLKAYDEEEYRLLRGELNIDDKVKPIVDLIKNNPEKIASMIGKIENEENRKKANEIVDQIKEELSTIDESIKIIKGELDKGESARVFTIAEKKLDLETSQMHLNNLLSRLLKYLKIEGKKPTSLSIETEGKSNVYNLDAERAKTIPEAFRDYNEFDIGRDLIRMGDLAEKLRKGDITADERKEMGRFQKLIDDITSKVERGEVSAIDAVKYAADQMESYSFLTGRSNYNDFALKALRNNLSDKIESELVNLTKNGELSIKLSSPLINKLNEHMQRILGDKVPILFVNKEELTKALKMLGITPESLVDALARHGIYPKDKSDLLKILSSIKGVTTLLDIKKPAILLVRNNPNIIKTAFHEVMEALTNSGQLPENAMKILEKAFSGKERHWKEEAADAFAKYYATEKLDDVPKYQQIVSKVFNKIKSIIDRVVNFFQGYGYLSPYDIFEDIANGKYRFLDKNGNVDPVKYDAYLGDKINELSLSLSPEFREKDDRHWSQKILDFINDVRKGIRDATMMSSFEKNFLPPQWIKREPIQKLLDIMIKSQESRNLSVYSTSKEFIDKYDGLSRDMKDKLDKAIIHSGELEVVLDDKELKDKFGLDEEAISAYKEFKTSMDKVFRDYITSKQRMIIDIISRMPGYRHITPEVKDKLIKSIIMDNPTQFVNSIKDLMNTTHKNTINAISEFIDRFTMDNNIELSEREKSELIDMLDDIVTNVDRLENYYGQLTKGFYFPRIRPNGRYAVKAYKYTTYIDSDGKEKTGWVDIYREHTKKGSGLRESIEATRIYNRVKRELQKQAYNVIEITDRNQLNEIKPKNENDIVLIKDINEAPSSLFYDNVTNEAVMRYLKYITEDLEERTTDETKKEMLKEIIDHITSNIDIDLRRRSMALSRLIQRERRVEKSGDEEMKPIITGGYDKDVAKSFKQYVVAMSGNISRTNTARSIKQLFDNQDIRKQITQDPNLFEYVKDYIEAVGIKANTLDRFSSMASSLLVSHFLGFRFSSAFVQLTQSALTGFSELQGFIKADADALRKYKPERYLSASDVKLNEYLETHGNVIGRYLKSYIEAAKIMAQYIRNPSSEGLVRTLSEKLNLTEGELSLLTKLINSKVESAYVLDLHRETTGKVPAWMASFTKNSLWLFARAEETSRIAGALAAYRLAKEKGLTREEAIEFASKYIDRAYHIYNIFNKPLIALKKDTSSVVRMLTLLKNYQINFIGWAYDSLKREDGKRYADKVVTSALWHMIFGGLFGVPLLKEVSNFFAWLLSKVTGEPYDPEKAVVNYIKKNIGEDAGKMAEFGIMSLLGVDISGSIRMDLLPKEWSETGIVDTLLGAWRGVGTGFTEAKLALERGDTLRALAALSPVIIDKSLVAYQNIANNEPMRTLYGTPITDPYGRPIKLSSSDMLLTLLGFRPITLAESSSTFQATDTIKKFYTKKRDSIYSKLRYAKTYEDLSKIIENDVNDYNMRVAKYGGAVPLITATSIKGVLKRAKGEPNKLAVLMDEWGELEDLEEAS